MRRYSHKIGADFIEFTNFSNQRIYGSAPSWFHLDAIRFLANQNWYDAMLLLDADQLVLPGCPDLFEMAEDKIAVVQDMGIPLVSDHYRIWCQRNFGDVPADGPYFNAGMIVIPTNAARRVLPFLSGPFPDEWPWDQHYLNRVFCQHEQLKWLPCEFNWLAPQFRDGAMQQKIVHFVGGHKNLLPDFVCHPDLC
jgi:lipopolysaccharide biosynthesis glycosyltransferase